ncbi:MAG: DsrE family protein [Verrucomicrobia bacterium]|nr:DsrE family protein [Verrucomicrobiota bacterium]
MSDTAPPIVLVIVTSDPRTSPRPAEAVRIAAGVAAWKKAIVRLHFQGPAVLCLSEFPDELMDEDNFTRYLPLLGDTGHPVTVESGSVHLTELGEAPVPFEEADASALSTLVAQATSVMRF